MFVYFGVLGNLSPFLERKILDRLLTAMQGRDKTAETEWRKPRLKTETERGIKR